MKDLFEVVREACSPAVWSRGVELVRSEAVSGEQADEREVTLRVSTRGGMHSPSVTLHLEDQEWECDCSSRDDPCEHVSAAVIALRQARKQGATLPSPATPVGRLRYLFSRSEGGLCFEREIVTGESRHLLTSTLDAIAKGRVDGPRFAASPADIDVELALGSNPRGRITRETLGRLVDALVGCSDVRLDGEPIEVSSERVVPRLVLEDAPGGFRLQLVADPQIRELFPNDAVLYGNTLRMKGVSRLTGREREDLPGGQFFSHEEAARLVAEVLPSLRSRVPVEIRSRALPKTIDAGAPRIRLELRRVADRLSVLPTLVYGNPPVARIDAGKLVPLQSGAVSLRDEAAERRVVRQLQSELELIPGHRIELSGERAVAFAEKLESWRGELHGDAHRSFYRAPQLEPRLEIDGTRFDLAFESNPGAEGGASGRVGANVVLAAWRSGESLVALPGGGFAPLPEQWLARFGERVADLLAARGEAVELPSCVLPDLLRLCDELEHPDPPSFPWLTPLLEGFEAIPRTVLPRDFAGELRSYQRAGVDWLCFLRDARLGALLADDMGLGKTVQALCALSGRSLVVAPTSVLHNWVEECRRFRPDLRLALYHGPKRALDPEAQVTLTSYALLRLDTSRLASWEWDQVVLDEAQAIKNPESQVAQAAFSLRARWRLALTGTPIENRLEELWSQFHFLNRGLLGGRRDFRERSTRPILEGDAEAIARLRERIRPFVLRRLKREVAPELPPRSEVVLHCVLDEKERQVYDAIQAATREEVVQQLATGGSVIGALEALLRLRQAACHSGLVPGQHADSSSKLELLLERLDQALADGHKALIFSQWTSLLDRLEPHLEARSVHFERLDGSTRDRGAVVKRFQEEGGAPVMLVSLKAGGTGLNLHAADHVFLLDPWWNPAVEDQAADRAHRIGQYRPVVVHRLVAEDTVEERILALQQSKRGLSDAALASGELAGSLGRQELLNLLS